MTSKIQIFGHMLALWAGHFYHFQFRNARFLDFSKFFGSCWADVEPLFVSLKEPIFVCILARMVGKWAQKFKFYVKFDPWSESFSTIPGLKSPFLDDFKDGLELFGSDLEIVKGSSLGSYEALLNFRENFPPVLIIFLYSHTTPKKCTAPQSDKTSSTITYPLETTDFFWFQDDYVISWGNTWGEEGGDQNLRCLYYVICGSTLMFKELFMQNSPKKQPMIPGVVLPNTTEYLFLQGLLFSNR